MAADRACLNGCQNGACSNSGECIWSEKGLPGGATPPPSQVVDGQPFPKAAASSVTGHSHEGHRVKPDVGRAGPSCVQLQLSLHHRGQHLFYFQVNVISSFGQSLPFKRITVGSTLGGILLVASVAERWLVPVGGRAPGCVACPALGGLLASKTRCPTTDQLYQGYTGVGGTRGTHGVGVHGVRVLEYSFSTDLQMASQDCLSNSAWKEQAYRLTGKNLPAPIYEQQTFKDPNFNNQEVSVKLWDHLSDILAT